MMSNPDGRRCTVFAIQNLAVQDTPKELVLEVGKLSRICMYFAGNSLQACKSLMVPMCALSRNRFKGLFPGSDLQPSSSGC